MTTSRDQALQSALERLPVAVIVVDGSGLLRPYNKRAGELFEREALQGDLLRARPSHPLAALITYILSTSAADVPAERTVVFPSGKRYRVEPSRRSERGVGRWLMLLVSAAESARSTEDQDIAKEWGFTPREQELATLLLRGMSTERIRDTLHIAQNTFKTHIKRLLQKTGTRTRAQLVAKLLKR